MTLRPLPKTVAPIPDELLSNWLTRLAATNYCEPSELLAHLGIDGRHAAMLDLCLKHRPRRELPWSHEPELKPFNR